MVSLKAKLALIAGLGVALVAVNQENNVQDIQKSLESCAHDGDGRLVSTKDGVNYTYMNNLRLVEAKGGETTFNSDGQLTVAYAGQMIENNDLIENGGWQVGNVSSLFHSVQACIAPEIGAQAMRYSERLPKNARIARQAVTFDM